MMKQKIIRLGLVPDSFFMFKRCDEIMRADEKISYKDKNKELS